MLQRKTEQSQVCSRKLSRHCAHTENCICSASLSMTWTSCGSCCSQRGPRKNSQCGMGHGSCDVASPLAMSVLCRAAIFMCRGAVPGCDVGAAPGCLGPRLGMLGHESGLGLGRLSDWPSGPLGCWLSGPLGWCPTWLPWPTPRSISIHCFLDHVEAMLQCFAVFAGQLDWTSLWPRRTGLVACFWIW